MYDYLTPKEKSIYSANTSNSNNLRSLDYSNFNNDYFHNKIFIESPQINQRKNYLLNYIDINKNKLLLPKQKRIIRIIYKNNSLNELRIKNMSKVWDSPSKLVLPKLKNLKANVSLSSLFKMPKPKTLNKNNIYQRAIKNINFSLNLHKHKSADEHLYKKRNILGVDKFMKENYYSDIENKYKDLVKTKYFRNDSKIKNEIISIKKFGAFWNKFIEYCSPIILLKKYHYQRKYLNESKTIEQKD